MISPAGSRTRLSLLSGRFKLIFDVGEDVRDAT
jgi:hypothetical protein